MAIISKRMLVKWMFITLLLILSSAFVSDAEYIINGSELEQKQIKPGEKITFNWTIESFLYEPEVEGNITYYVIIESNATGGKNWNWSISPHEFMLMPKIPPLRNKTVTLCVVAPQANEKSTIEITLKFIIFEMNSTKPPVIIEKYVSITTSVPKVDEFLSEIEFLIRFLVALGIGAMIG
ncbi:MAG: hypothetical protein QXT63_05500, partial [Thermoplasmata archaeon]